MNDDREYKSALTSQLIKAQARFGAYAAPALATKVLAKRYGKTGGQRRIENFIRKYDINYAAADRCSTNNSVSSCATKYRDLNDFFTRKLRDITIDSAPLVSPATCKAVVFDTFPASTVWVKGRHWSLDKLLKRRDISPQDYAIGIFRLRPADYHRFHAPFAGTVRGITEVQGQYLSVDPAVVRSPQNVFTENRRAILEIESPVFGRCFFVAVGAAGVGAVVLSVKEGGSVQPGDELGKFEFGGSTVLVLLPNPEGRAIWSAVLAEMSRRGQETYVRVGQAV